MMTVKINTIIRTVVLILALVNQCLTAAGHKIIPISDDQIAELITLLFTVAASVWSWWKNNSFTHAALMADEMMAEIRASEHHSQ